jgi:hypothetical protein
MNSDIQTVAGKVQFTIICECGLQITLLLKPGDVINITCKCGRTLTAVVPMRLSAQAGGG